jgi:hypothetical protein
MVRAFSCCRPERPLRHLGAVKTAKAQAGDKCRNRNKQQAVRHGCDTRGETKCAEAPDPLHRRVPANMMRPLLALSRGIDLLNEKSATSATRWSWRPAWSAPAMRWFAMLGQPNGWLELQWYMFAILVMFWRVLHLQAQ